MIQRSRGRQLPRASPLAVGVKYVRRHVVNVECV